MSEQKNNSDFKAKNMAEVVLTLEMMISNFMIHT